ncbi:hypothetical protein [Stenotrophomonas geniculata]|uniref:hypothetical protein n=1 Tax=Stenotrophomonas geniculata TaxID=86188 RepID=UPI002E79C459|nr:hypothetical protein [Stenotrophomonas geniculata]
MIKKILFSSVLLAAGYASGAGAETISCDGCTPAEMQEWAMMTAAYSGNSYSEIYVINRHEGKIRRYAVTLDQPGQDVPGQIPDGSTSYGSAVEYAVPVPIADYFSIAVQIDGKTYFMPMGAGLPDSMYDVVNNPAREATMLDWVRTTPENSFNTPLMRAQMLVNIPVFDLNKVKVSITLHAVDGSYAVVVFDPIEKKWQRLPNSTRDSSNNLIPATKSELTGGVDSFRQYHFNNSMDQGRFVNQAVALGATFVGSVGSAPGGVVCTSILKSTTDGQERQESITCSSD